MATIDNAIDYGMDDQEQGQSDNLQLSGQSSAPGGGGGVAKTGGDAGTGKSSSGQFTNLQTYLDANQGNIGSMAVQAAQEPFLQEVSSMSGQIDQQMQNLLNAPEYDPVRNTEQTGHDTRYGYREIGSEYDQYLNQVGPGGLGYDEMSAVRQQFPDQLYGTDMSNRLEQPDNNVIRYTQVGGNLQGIRDRHSALQQAALDPNSYRNNLMSNTAGGRSLDNFLLGTDEAVQAVQGQFGDIQQTQQDIARSYLPEAYESGDIARKRRDYGRGGRYTDEQMTEMFGTPQYEDGELKAKAMEKLAGYNPAQSRYNQPVWFDDPKTWRQDAESFYREQGWDDALRNLLGSS